MNNYKNLYFGLLLAVGFSAALPAQANLLANSDFGAGSFIGWTQSGDTSFTSVDTANSGVSYYAALGPADFGYLSQIVIAVPGQRLDITGLLAVQEDADPNGPTNEFQILLNGAILYDSLDLAPAGYFQIAASGTAIASNTISFGFMNPLGGFFFTNADVTASDTVPVPEPSAMAMLLVTLSAVGLTHRGRRSWAPCLVSRVS